MNPDMDAIYILSPKPHIVDCLMADFERRRYRKTFLVWIALLDPQMRRRIDTSRQAKEQLAGFETLSIDYFPRESHLITFRDPWSFPILYHPACNNLVRDHMQILAQKVGVSGRGFEHALSFLDNWDLCLPRRISQGSVLQTSKPNTRSQCPLRPSSQIRPGRTRCIRTMEPELPSACLTTPGSSCYYRQVNGPGSTDNSRIHIPGHGTRSITHKGKRQGLLQDGRE